MYYQPTPIDFKDLHFLIMSAPDSNSMKKCVLVRFILSVKIVCEGPSKAQREDACAMLRQHVQ